MDFGRIALDPDVAARRFAVRLEEAGLPPFVSAAHDAELDLLRVAWAHGVTLYMDLRHDGIVEPIDEQGRAVILGLRPCCEECAKVDVHAAGCADDPREDTPIPGCSTR
jgi:hypothetical protein